MQPFDPVLGDYVVTRHAVQGIEGELLSVRTDKGNRVSAWRCTMEDSENRQGYYFAHGYSLQTHELYGYSIVFGADLKRVLADECVRVGTLGPAFGVHLRRDDILVWWSGSEPLHSAIVEVPIADTATRGLNEQATIVSSKSGSGRLQPAVSLAFVKREHPSSTSIEAYRRA